MKDIAVIACELADADPKLIQMVEPPSNQTVVKRLSTDRIRALGWEPTVTLEEGMARTMEWVMTLDKEGAVAA